MPTWTDVPLNTACDPPTTLGVVKLPKATADLAEARVLVTAAGETRLLKVDYRSDGGTGACLSERDYRALGKSQTAKYRPVTKLEALRLDPSLRLALFTALITFASAVLGVILTFNKATAPNDTTSAGPSTEALAIAAVVAVLAFIIALLKLNKDLNEI